MMPQSNQGIVKEIDETDKLVPGATQYIPYHAVI